MGNLETIRQTVGGMNREQAAARLQEVLANENLSIYELGALLTKHKTEAWYAGKDFKNFLFSEVRMDLDDAQRAMRVYDNVTAAELTDDDLKGISRSNLILISAFLGRAQKTQGVQAAKQIQELIRLARTTPYTLLRYHAKKVLGMKQGVKDAKNELEIKAKKIRGRDDAVVALTEFMSLGLNSLEVTDLEKCALVFDTLSRVFHKLQINYWIAGSEDGVQAFGGENADRIVELAEELKERNGDKVTLRASLKNPKAAIREDLAEGATAS